MSTKDCFGFYRYQVTNTIIEPGQDELEQYEIESVDDYYEPSEIDLDDDYDWFLHPIGGFEEPKELSEITRKERPTSSQIADIISAGKNFISDLSLFDGKFQPQPIDFKDYLDKFNVFNSVLEMDHDFRNPNMIRMVGEQFKEEVITAMKAGKFRMNLSLTVDEDDFLKSQLRNILNPHIDRSIGLTKALKLLDHNINLMIKIFQEGYRKFKELDFSITKLPFSVDSLNDQELKKLFLWKEEDAIIRFAILKKIRIVYMPSGSGKTNLASRNSELFYDVDTLIKDYKELWNKVLKLSELHKKKRWFIVNHFYKYVIFNLDYEKLTGKILLLNHPNQVPNCFKIRTNELILLPYALNWRVRFFAENFFSLLFCNNYVKRFCEYGRYKSTILDFFKVQKCKKKKSTSQLLANISITPTISSFSTNVENEPFYQPDEPNRSK